MSKNTTNGGSVVKQLKEVQGLFTCFLEHVVSKTSVQFKWTGPVIPVEEWDAMLAFFQWSYDTTKSETQARMYVNPTLNTWKIWAYPQEAKTGMSARELDTDKAKEQRARFNPSEGWLYFGTVHHHCACSAFQSPTDENNEKNQDGIHITVGNMDAKRYTLHERFYLSGQKIEHDLSWFWNVDAAMNTVPEWARKHLPDNLPDRIARGQMCDKVDPAVTFPEEWKDNLVYVAPLTIQHSHSYVGGLGYSPNNSIGARFQRKAQNLHFDLTEARQQLQELIVTNNLEELDVLGEMQKILKGDKFLVELIDLMYRNDVTLEKFTEYCAEKFIEETDEAAKAKEPKQLTDRKTTGVPDYDGPNYGNPNA